MRYLALEYIHEGGICFALSEANAMASCTKGRGVRCRGAERFFCGMMMTMMIMVVMVLGGNELNETGDGALLESDTGSWFVNIQYSIPLFTFNPSLYVPPLFPVNFY